MELTTKRLILSTLKNSDVDKILKYLGKNRSFFEPWNPHREEFFYTTLFQKKQLQKSRRAFKNRRELRLWILKNSDPSQIIGDLSFTNIIEGAFSSCFLGYKMDETAINQGYITEALERAILYVFQEMKLHRIEANILPRNLRSLRVVEKLGFEYEGLSKKYLKINGVWEDHLHYVLLNSSVE